MISLAINDAIIKTNNAKQNSNQIIIASLINIQVKSQSFIFISSIKTTQQQMNYIVANGICCCLQCCCKELFETLSKLLGKNSFIKVMYCVVYATFVGILLGAFVFLRDWGWFMDYVARGISCNKGDDFDCITVALVFRIVTAISLFIIILLLTLSLCTVRISYILNEGLFFSKFVLIAILFIILLQFDNTILQHLSTLYQYTSYIFLLCQGIIIIDLGYLWGIRWAARYSAESSTKYFILLIAFTVVMFSLSVGLNVYGYVIVAGDNQMTAEGQQCSQLPNILATVFIIVIVIVQLLNFNKQNSLLTTSFVSVYIIIWLFSSIYSSPYCLLDRQTLSSQHHYSKPQFYPFSTALSIFWLLLSTFGSIFGSTNQMHQIQSQDSSHLNQFIQLQDHSLPNSKNGSNHNNPQNQQQLSYLTAQNKRNWLIWHIFMLTAIVYLSMLVSDWGSGNLITQKYSMNQNAYYSKIMIAVWTFIAYIWTLVAPRLFPERNFYFV